MKLAKKPKETKCRVAARRQNLKEKRVSTEKEIKEENFIIGTAIRMGVPLELRRKVKKSKQEMALQRFTIERIYNEEIQKEVEIKFQKWIKRCEIEGIIPIQRDISRCRQIIIYQRLMRYMEKSGQQILYTITKGSTKMVKRDRIASFNKCTSEQIHEIGEKITEYLIDSIPIVGGKNRDECKQIIQYIPKSIEIPLKGTTVDTNQPQYICMANDSCDNANNVNENENRNVNININEVNQVDAQYDNIPVYAINDPTQMMMTFIDAPINFDIQNQMIFFNNTFPVYNNNGEYLYDAQFIPYEYDYQQSGIQTVGDEGGNQFIEMEELPTIGEEIPQENQVSTVVEENANTIGFQTIEEEEVRPPIICLEDYYDDSIDDINQE